MLLNEHHFDEWKECRSSIARFDKVIVDLRKYGFTLITGLLTADAILFVKIPDLSPVDKAAVSFVTMILVSALFFVDRYQGILLRSAVKRTEDIESELNLKLTTKISTITRRSNTDEWGTALYIFFIVASAIPTFAAAVKFYLADITVNWCLIIIMSSVAFVFSLAIWKYHCFTKRKFEEYFR